MFYHNINPVLLEIGPFQIRYYGLFWAIGFFMSYFLIYHLAKRKRLDLTKDDISDFIVYQVVGVVLGSRIVYILFYNLTFYFQNPLEILALWHGGLSFHGGLIGSVASCWLYSRRKKKDFFEMADLTVIPVALALALGRIGNFINGELYGRITNLSWCVDYSKSQYVSGVEGCRHPSQIYESAKNIFIFAVLWILKDKKLPKGFLFWSFVTMYGFFRTIVEFFRQPDEQIGFLFAKLSMGQVLSMPLFLLGLFMIIRLRLLARKSDKNP